MTDIRRTVLWVVFTMSLVLLWDGWQKHNGHPSMFSPAPVAKQPAAAPAKRSGRPALKVLRNEPQTATPARRTAPRKRAASSA